MWGCFNLNLFHRKSKDSQNKNYISGEVIIQEFDNYFQSDHEKDYKQVNKVYNHIYSIYKAKIDNKELNISVEKIRLEKSIGKYQSAVTKNSTTIITGMLCVFIQFAIVDGMKAFGVQNDFLKYALTYALLFWFLNYMSNDTNKSKPKDVMTYISLKVLDDLEKEYSIENEKKKDVENQQAIVEQLKSENTNSKKDVIMDIVAPAMLEVAATVVQKSSLVKRIFKKGR